MLWVTISVFVFLAFLIMLAVHIGRKHPSDADQDKEMQQPPALGESASCSSCSLEGCNKSCMTDEYVEPEYFDDEELDRFRGRHSSEYTDKEAEEFRDILYSMRQEEVRDWFKSLTQRSIEVPDQIKDELILMLEN